MTTPREFNLSDLDEIDRSKIRVNETTGCWEWTASLDGRGYGSVHRHGRVLKAHRHIYGVLVGPIENNIHQLDHLCRVRHCVNPAHLEPVEPIENVRRGMAAISVDLPRDLLLDVAKLAERAYKRGYHDGLANGRRP